MSKREIGGGGLGRTSNGEMEGGRRDLAVAITGGHDRFIRW